MKIVSNKSYLLKNILDSKLFCLKCYKYLFENKNFSQWHTTNHILLRITLSDKYLFHVFTPVQFLQQTPLYIAESVTCTCTLCIVVNQRVCHFLLFTPVCSFTFACLYEQLFNKMWMYICIIDFCSYAVIEKSIKFTFIFCVHSKMFFFY